MSKSVELQGTIGRETENAILFTTEDDDEVWIPLSQVESINRQQGKLVVTRWIAEKKGLL